MSTSNARGEAQRQGVSNARVSEVLHRRPVGRSGRAENAGCRQPDDRKGVGQDRHRIGGRRRQGSQGGPQGVRDVVAEQP